MTTLSLRTPPYSFTYLFKKIYIFKVFFLTGIAVDIGDISGSKNDKVHALTELTFISEIKQEVSKYSKSPMYEPSICKLSKM